VKEEEVQKEAPKEVPNVVTRAAADDDTTVPSIYAHADNRMTTRI